MLLFVKVQLMNGQSQQNAVVVQPSQAGENQIVYQPDGSAQIQTGVFSGRIIQSNMLIITLCLLSRSVTRVDSVS